MINGRAMKTVAIMQPYFFPYIGYFQLIAAADVFIVYDNIKYTKSGWINRNRMLLNGKDAMFSLPLKKASDCLDVRDRELAADFNPHKVLNQISGAYRRAPFFMQTFPLIEAILCRDERNLFTFIHHSLVATCKHIGISTEIRISSSIAIDHNLKNQAKVLALCAAVGASIYVNAIGGMELYSKDQFLAHGVELKFIKSTTVEYEQFGDTFVPWLSIIDVMMFNPVEAVAEMVRNKYQLVSGT